MFENYPFLNGEIISYTWNLNMWESPFSIWTVKKIECDVNIKVMQEIMGHANIETTLQIYAEVSQEKKKEALEYVAEVYDVFNQERVRERS